MKKHILLFVVMIFLMAEDIFASSVITQRVVRACGFVKGSSTLKLSGQMNDAAMQSISSGNSMEIYNSLDSYLVFPTLFPRTKTGFGVKTINRNVSIKTKNGKFKWTEKDVAPYFSFVTGEERIQPSKAVFKSQGTLQTSELSELDNKRFTVFDRLCAEQGLGYLASLSFTPETKGKNYKFSHNEGKFKVKGSINPKGKITAKYALPFEVAYPAIVESEDFSSNKYDYSLVIIGKGDVYSGFYEPDKVEFIVTENNKNFRYYSYNDMKVTNDFMKLELENDTEVTAVFGTYDFSLNVIGNGSVSAEFTGSDDVDVKVTENKDKFRYFTVNGKKYMDSEMTLSLQEDTIVEAVFGNYDLTLEVIGNGSANAEFIGSDEAEVKVTENNKKFRYFLYNGIKVTNDFIILELENNTEVQAIFGTYDFSLNIVGNGSASAEFIGPDDVDVKVTENKDKFRYFTVNGEKYMDSEMTLFLQEDTIVEAVFGNYDLTLKVIGNGSASAEFIGSDEAEVKISENNAKFRYYSYNGIKVTNDFMKLKLEDDTEVTAVFGTYVFSLEIVGNGLASAEFTGPDEFEFKVTENKDKFRYLAFNGIKITNDFITLELENDTKAQAVFGTYDFSLNVVGNGSVSAEFIGPDEIEVKVTENNAKFRYFSVNGKKYTVSKTLLALQNDTVAEAVFGNYDISVTISGKGLVNHAFVGPDKVRITAVNGEEFFNSFKWDGNISYENPLIFTLTRDTELFATFKEGGKYAVIDLSGGSSAESYPISWLDDVPEGGWTEEYKTTKLVLRKIEPGSFVMGSPENEVGRDDNEDQHDVSLTKGYYIGVFEITQKQFEIINGNNPSHYKGDLRPVESVTCDMLRGKDKGAKWSENHMVDDDSFFGKLQTRTKMIFDLPTEAQWEFACRAGTTTALNSGKNLTGTGPGTGQCTNMQEVGRYYHNTLDGRGNYRQHTIVGSYLVNNFGLYDMHGNVCEMCLDSYQASLGRNSKTDPMASILFNSNNHVLRGGSCNDFAESCRSASRRGSSGINAHIQGFRVVIYPACENKKQFKYELLSESEDTCPVFKVELYGKLKDGSKYLLKDIGKVEKDGASGIVVGKGKHVLTWTPGNENMDLMDDIELVVEYEDVTSQASYLVLNLLTNEMRTSKTGPNLRNEKCCTDELWLKRIEPGIFTMGSPANELGRDKNENQHKVTITNAFYIGVFEMTQKQFETIASFTSNSDVGNNYRGDKKPVENATFNMIKKDESDEGSFFSILEAKAGNNFNLPTEEQWEYACRAGTTTALNSGKDLTSKEECPNMNEVGRYYYNGGGISQVGSYLPNAWGLYDMHGNVNEICQNGMKRGGCGNYPANSCRAASRKRGETIFTGFRVIVSTDNQIQKDFKYELPKSGMYVFKVNFYGKTKDGATYLLKDLGELKNEGSSGIVLGGGEHTVTLLYERAYQSLLDEIELMVKYEDVTSKADYLVLDLSSNEMRTSVTGPDIKDGLCRTDELWLKRIHSNINYHNCFYIGIFEITQKQFKTTSNKNPSAYLGDIRPVENVSYKTTSEFLEKLVEKTGNKFNLPTEEQWEYACTTDVQDMDEVGRYADDSDDGKGGYSEHTVVGSYSPNKWGLYDMLGNVCEWCKENNDIYVVRGGGWRDEARDCCYWSRIEVANDSYHNDRYGFRVVLPQY